MPPALVEKPGGCDTHDALQRFALNRPLKNEVQTRVFIPLGPFGSEVGNRSPEPEQVLEILFVEPLKWRLHASWLRGRTLDSYAKHLLDRIPVDLDELLELLPVSVLPLLQDPSLSRLPDS